MNNTISYSSYSISNLLKDDNHIYPNGSPLPEKTQNAVKVNAHSTVAYRYSWNGEKDVLACPSIRLKHSIYEETGTVNTLYSTDIQLILKIHYYQENSTADGIWQVINILPMLIGEQDYTNYIDIELQDNLIHEIFLYIKNNANYDIFVKSIDILRGRTGEQTITDTYGMAVTLQSIETFDNGCRIYYDDSEGVPTVLVFGKDEEGGLANITVNPKTESERVIQILKNPGKNIQI